MKSAISASDRQRLTVTFAIISVQLINAGKLMHRQHSAVEHFD